MRQLSETEHYVDHAEARLHYDDDPKTAAMMAAAPQIPDGATWANALRTIHDLEGRVNALESKLSQFIGDF